MLGVRLVGSLARVVLLPVALVAALAATPAEAAPTPVHLGGVGSAATTGSATASGGCICTVAQMQEANPTSNPI